MNTITYKIVMGFSINKILKEIEVYEIGNNSIHFMKNYGDGRSVYEYMEVNTEDTNVLIVLLGLLLEKMELSTPILETGLNKIGVGLEDFMA